MEFNGEDQRQKSLTERRKLLEKIIVPINHSSILLSEIIPFINWDQLVELRKGSREMNSEGIMLKKNFCLPNMKKKGLLVEMEN